MYSTQHAVMGGGSSQGRSVAPETFLLDQDAQQSLPADSIVALQQVDNRTFSISISPTSAPSSLVSSPHRCSFLISTHSFPTSASFLISALSPHSGSFLISALSPLLNGGSDIFPG
jgi:hypothetical protein